MPKPLKFRCGADTVLGFREAARQRFMDGLALAVSGRRTGAIYLWGYSAEMLLKAAYFELVGFAGNTAITTQHLHAAKGSAFRFGIQ